MVVVFVVKVGSKSYNSEGESSEPILNVEPSAISW
jgi:hypothetical protein